MYRISIITIAYKSDSSLASTIISVKDFARSLLARPVQINHALVVGLEDQFNIENFLDNLDFTPNLSHYKSIGQDSGVYSAMNIGVSLVKNVSDFVVFINSGVLINMSLSAESLLESLTSHPTRILFASSIEIVKNFQQERIWHPTSNPNWPHLLPIMPCCHHSIFYPIAVFHDHYYLTSPGFLASDYLHLISLISSGYDRHQTNQIFSVYKNDGLSFSRPYTSILQRMIAYFIVFKSPLRAVYFAGLFCGKHFFRTIIHRLSF